MRVSPLLADILKRSTSGSRCKVVGEVAGTAHLLAGVRWRRADVVLVGLDREVSTSALEKALHSRPRLRILGIERNGQRLFAYELRMNRVALGELTLSELVDLIGSVARVPQGSWTDGGP